MSRQHHNHQRPTSHPGPHELGQNLLVDRRRAAEMAEILRHAPPLPIVELGAGDGAITRHLVALGRPVTAVEIDHDKAQQLRRVFGRRITVVEADLLRVALPRVPHHVVSNVPFGITTPLLRRLLRTGSSDRVVLLLQWEVARKRAAVGGTTLLTAAWWPWYRFELHGRVPASAFAPRPAVDGGVLVIDRRSTPLVAPAARDEYQQFVRAVFSSPGHGIGQVLERQLPRRVVRRWLIDEHLSARQLPRDLVAHQWASLFRLSSAGGRREVSTRRPDDSSAQATHGRKAPDTRRALAPRGTRRDRPPAWPDRRLTEPATDDS